jgi:hypothetical protein
LTTEARSRQLCCPQSEVDWMSFQTETWRCIKVCLSKCNRWHLGGNGSHDSSISKTGDEILV